MSNGRQHFRKTDATRLIKVPMDAGLEVRKVTVDCDGRIEIEDPHRSPAPPESTTDEWKVAS
jgi:hypothetical protein